MKIVFNNLINGSGITNQNPSANYPASNLVHPILTKRYQPTAGETLDVIYLPINSNGACWQWSEILLFLGYLKNVNYIDIEPQGKKTVGGAWQTEADYASEYAAYSETRDRVTDSGETRITDAGDVRSVEVVEVFLVQSYDGDPFISSIKTAINPEWVECRIKVTVVFSAIGGYIGGASIGEPLNIDNVLSSYELPLSDNSTFTETAGGQTLQIKQAILNAHEFTIPDLTIEKKNEIIAAYKQIGKGFPFFMTFFNPGVTDILPEYVKFIKEPETTKNGRRFNVTLFFREAR